MTKSSSIGSTKEAAEAIGVSTKRLNALKNKGALVAYVGRNQWNLGILELWNQKRIATSSQAHLDPESQKHRQRFEKARTEKLEFQVAILKGEMRPRAEVHREWAARLSLIINGLTIYQDRLPPLLEGKTRNQMRAVIKKENNHLISSYSRAGEISA